MSVLEHNWTFDFNTYFTRQVEALGKPDDILFLISAGGGDSANRERTMQGGHPQEHLGLVTRLKGLAGRGTSRSQEEN